VWCLLQKVSTGSSDEVSKIDIQKEKFGKVLQDLMACAFSSKAPLLPPQGGPAALEQALVFPADGKLSIPPAACHP
jgi:hypothetical protein